MAAERGAPKRRCVSTACIACRRRKSKCDGNLPSCAACSSVYNTPCVYDPSSDHRRKGAYKKDVATLRTRHTTLQTLVQALLNYEEDDAFELVRQIRSCDDLEDIAQSIISRERGILAHADAPDQPISDVSSVPVDQFESELSGRMSELVLGGSRKFIGGTSNLVFLPPGSELHESSSQADHLTRGVANDACPVRRWTQVTEDDSLISHLLTMYFTWHYPFFTVLAKDIFYRDYIRGISSPYCSALLVNAMLALGCHFSSWSGAFSDPQTSATAGDHFFKEAKRLILENDEHENAKLCTVQAFALLSLREAGCGREGKGWVYSGLSFRMAFDLGLNVDATNLGSHSLSDEEIDARRITFWGCYLIDKCWSNYLGRQPQLSSSNTNVAKFDILPKEEAQAWSPYVDSGVCLNYTQPSRIRTVSLQISRLCEISGDLLVFFYHPADLEKSQPKQLELKKLSDIHTRLETWKKELPRELDTKEGQLPQALIMHMLHQLLLIHLYRPFLRYRRANTPLPSHVSPRKVCTQAASTISKLLRMYKRTYGLRQICNIVVYIAHTACTIHLLNLPDKNAQRDVIHGLRNLEEMAAGWLCARRTLRILDISASKWQVELPAEAKSIFERTQLKWGSWGSWDQVSSPSSSEESPVTQGNLHPSMTSSSRLSFESNTAAVQLTEPYKEDPASMVSASMGPPYQAPSTTVAMSMHPIRGPSYMPTAEQKSHKSSFAPPEPTYLRPNSGVRYPSLMPPSYGQPSASSPAAWYDDTGAQVTPHTTMSQASNLSSISGFDGAENLVGESQDWWTRNAAALGTGMETWHDTWSPDMPNLPSYLQYDDKKTPPVPLAQHDSPTSVAEREARVTGGVTSVASVAKAMPPSPEYDTQWKYQI